GLERLRDRYFSKGTQNWVKYTAEIYEYQKKSLEQEKKNIISLYDDISKYAQERLTEVVNKQAVFAEKIKDSGRLFNKNTVTIDGVSDTYYSMHNMQEDIKRIKLYQSLLEEFEERADRLGVSEDIKNGFLKELREEDFNSVVSLLNYMKGSTDESVFNYLSAWNEKNILANSVAAKSFEPEFNESIEDSYKKMKEVLSAAGYEIPESFFASGSLSAQKFGDAFIEEIEVQMARIRSIIDAFNGEISGYSNMYGGNTYNTSNTSYNIQSDNARDTVEEIKRYETVKRLAGIA
nr:hypothetical protein [Bacillota bacterium]